MEYLRVRSTAGERIVMRRHQRLLPRQERIYPTPMDLRHRAELVNARLAPSTQRSYFRAYTQLVHWYRRHRTDLDRHVMNPQQLDDEVSTYLTRMYHKYNNLGLSGLAYGNHTLYGLLHHQPTLRKDQLPLCVRALEGWKTRKPHKSHPPVEWRVAVAMAVTMESNGHRDAAVATLLAWDCYLRVNELVKLKVRRVVAPGDPGYFDHPESQTTPISGGWRTDRATQVCLRKTKTGMFHHVTIEDRRVEQVLAHHVRGKHPDSKVFNLDAKQYCMLFRQAKNALGMHNIPFTPHSLRHGGATSNWKTYGAGSLPTVVMRGRWRSYASASLYIQQGPAMMAQYRAPDTARQLAISYDNSSLVAFLTRPRR